MPQTLNLDDLENITNVMEANWAALAWQGLGPVTYHLNQSARSFSVNDGNGIWDYYFLEMQGFVQVEIPPNHPAHDWQLEAFVIDLSKVRPESPQIDLIDTQPPTANSVGSYTTAISGTLSGSVGFFGPVPTGSIGGSITYSRSSTTQVAALSILNQSKLNHAHWMFKVQPGSPMAQGQTPINVIALARTPHGAGDQTFGVTLGVYLRNPSGPTAADAFLESAGFDLRSTASETVPQWWSCFVAIVPGPSPEAPTYIEGLDNSDGRICRFDFRKTLTVKAPPSPAST